MSLVSLPLILLCCYCYRCHFCLVQLFLLWFGFAWDSEIPPVQPWVLHPLQPPADTCHVCDSSGNVPEIQSTRALSLEPDSRNAKTTLMMSRHFPSLLRLFWVTRRCAQMPEKDGTRKLCFSGGLQVSITIAVWFFNLTQLNYDSKNSISSMFWLGWTKLDILSWEFEKGR